MCETELVRLQNRSDSVLIHDRLSADGLQGDRSVFNLPHNVHLDVTAMMLNGMGVGARGGVGGGVRVRQRGDVMPQQLNDGWRTVHDGNKEG